MITIEGYNLYYNTNHILEPKPKTYKDVINRLENIECKLFYNIISSPTCRYEKNFSKGRIKEHYKKMDAKSRFENIFNEKIIYANPKSFFVNKLNSPPLECDEIKSVSFTLSDYQEIPKHFEARDSEYGICFFHDFLQNKGIRPVEYLNQNDIERNKKLVFNSPHLIEVITSNYDMRWEKEWRIYSDLNFTQEDIAFVIVPPEEHDYFVNWFSESNDFQEIIILSSNTFKSYIDHLIQYPQLTNNSWDQVEILRDPYGSGLKIDPEEFNTLDYTSKQAFSLEFGKELKCFAKNTILLSYEYAYVNRFKRFRDKLQDIKGLGDLFKDYQFIDENIDEPEDAERDLVIGLFGDLYMKYPLYKNEEKLGPPLKFT